MKNIQHQELKMQDYLSLENVTVNQAKVLLKFRTRMANYGQNVKGTNKLSQCQLCDEHLDSQDTICQCKTNMKNFNTNFNYDDIFLEKIEVNLIKTLETIYKFKENEQVKKKWDKFEQNSTPGALLLDPTKANSQKMLQIMFDAVLF